MVRISFGGVAAVVFLACALVPAGAQVRSPAQMRDGNARDSARDTGAQALEQKYLPELKAIGDEIEAHKFPYHFYLSRALDGNEARQQQSDRRSIRFERYEGQLVLAITGNYYASYSTKLMDKNQRVRKTMEDVVLPLLRAASPRLSEGAGFDAFAIEVSHHVRGNLLGLSAENPENIMFVISPEAAQRLIAAATPAPMQSALLDSKVFLDGEPFQLWLTDAPPENAPAEDELAWQRARRAPVAKTPALVRVASAEVSPLPVATTVSGSLFKPPAARLVTPQTLQSLRLDHAEAVAGLSKALEPQAHLVSYAPPDFIGFHGGAYLQLSLRTDLDLSGDASRYKRAALAFDDHISHLVRPALAYLQGAADFDGISFSSTVRQSGNERVEAVEFYFPFKSMECYVRYDCSGQMLIDSGLVLINGERVTLTLETAEMSARN
jgi:hypothetical protein